MVKQRLAPPPAQIAEMVRRIVRHCDPNQIILFGSQTRKTVHADSDVNLLVVILVKGSKRAKQVELRRVLHDIYIPGVEFACGRREESGAMKSKKFQPLMLSTAAVSNVSPPCTLSSLDRAYES
jgi:predicted nucleotidyltransferase